MVPEIKDLTNEERSPLLKDTREKEDLKTMYQITQRKSTDKT